MNTGLISTRYATALLDFAIEQNQQERVYSEIKTLLHAYSDVNNFREVLANPAIHVSEKRKLIHTACGGDISKPLEQFIDLLLKNKREERLQYIALRFLELYRKKFGILNGALITATKVDKPTYNRLKSFIESKTGETLELERQTDASILGGFILQVGDDRLDASVSRQLLRIKNEWDETDINKKISKQKE
ncbi:MAG: F0F1 ATP synthase subunit delta [Petrimonas sp.]|uniref:F0F1 ATP synthase subunit delta n=1 Tax=Petrimonas sp. TaxID=2023866 RepID=UPI000965BD7C|nr:F0F1 ATP synthase subunit delta [Petrimonas sp.]MEA4980560.1 F0F1 ATP synthase subunit delta [Petrimonas sp.]MEA5045929.1 F0F1 ATP synthase subunit delta [Petrimonas sp.]MEA5063855.1 F0F1 ATP synthase subunit delta [Petrimonas sp.]OJV33096.1 MAG: ATP synthase F1 subunit delta [Bacteroidia bacterium 43-41]